MRRRLLISLVILLLSAVTAYALTSCQLVGNAMAGSTSQDELQFWQDIWNDLDCG